jgi:hypothetical protein
MDALLNLTGDRVDGRQVAFEALGGLAEAAVPPPWPASGRQPWMGLRVLTFSPPVRLVWPKFR